MIRLTALDNEASNHAGRVTIAPDRLGVPSLQALVCPSAQSGDLVSLVTDTGNVLRVILGEKLYDRNLSVVRLCRLIAD